MSYTNSLLGGAEREFYAPKTYGKAEMGKEDYLKLLAVQMQNQDPTNPTSNEDLTTELATFSSLEQLTNISAGIESLRYENQASRLTDAAGFIGNEVRAIGENVSIREDNTIATLYYKLANDAQSVTFRIYDKNNNLIQSVEASAQAEGEHKFEWDGKNKRGEDMPEGLYWIGVEALDKDGDPVLSQSEVTGVVEGVVTEGLQHYLRLSDGRHIPFDNVTEVVKGSQERVGDDTEGDS